MRTREKRYCDYGFRENEATKLKNYIQRDNFSESKLLMHCCEESFDCLSGLLFRSLKEHLSYDKLELEEYIPLGRDDFYGYQRKALFIFRESLIAEGKYPVLEKEEQI